MRKQIYEELVPRFKKYTNSLLHSVHEGAVSMEEDPESESSLAAISQKETSG